MAENKTQYTDASVSDLIDAIENEQKRADSYKLIALMEATTQEKARMFGSSIIGFGKYRYKYNSGHEGEAPLIGFSPRKAAISLYVFCQGADQEILLPQLGKHKMGKACIYIKKMSDIDIDILQQLMHTSIEFISKRFARI